MEQQHVKIAENIELHERIAHQYDDRHSEIYNEIEQQRLHGTLRDAVEAVRTGSDPVYALDFGCGSGNLTRHLLDHGCRVMTADVTPSFVRMSSALAPDRTVPHILNGVDLREIPSNTVDLAATYSVLHHVPDYETAVREMARVIRPGGIIYLDHERSESYWAPPKELQELYSRTRIKRSIWWYLSRFFIPQWWVKRIKKTINPRYQEEGDIHVWPDDHIEWPRIREILADSGFDLIRDEAYLMYEAHYPRDVFERYAQTCDDLRLIVARKRS